MNHSKIGTIETVKELLNLEDKKDYNIDRPIYPRKILTATLCLFFFFFFFFSPICSVDCVMSSFDPPNHRYSALVLILLLLGFSVAAADDVSWTEDSSLESPGCTNKFQMVHSISYLYFVSNHSLVQWS